MSRWAPCWPSAWTAALGLAAVEPCLESLGVLLSGLTGTLLLRAA